MEHSLFVGIDVAKERLDVHLRPTGETFSVGHDEAGLIALTERLVPCAPAIVALEATGGYEVTVAAALASAGLPWRWSTHGKSGTSPGRRGSSPRQMPSMRASSPCSPRRSGPSPGRYPMRKPRS
jgi:hypothetical protein